MYLYLCVCVLLLLLLLLEYNATLITVASCCAAAPDEHEEGRKELFSERRMCYLLIKHAETNAL